MQDNDTLTRQHRIAIAIENIEHYSQQAERAPKSNAAAYADLERKYLANMIEREHADALVWNENYDDHQAAQEPYSREYYERERRILAGCWYMNAEHRRRAARLGRLLRMAHIEALELDRKLEADGLSPRWPLGAVAIVVHADPEELREFADHRGFIDWPLSYEDAVRLVYSWKSHQLSVELDPQL